MEPGRKPRPREETGTPHTGIRPHDCRCRRHQHQRTRLHRQPSPSKLAPQIRIRRRAPRKEPKTASKKRVAQQNTARRGHAQTRVRVPRQPPPPSSPNARAAANSPRPSPVSLRSIRKVDDRGARRPSTGVAARPPAREPARRPPAPTGAAAAGPQGALLARGGGARVRGGGGVDRAHAMGQTREEDSTQAPPTIVCAECLFTCRSLWEPRGVGVAARHRLPVGCCDGVCGR
jgi:hypothetical protein